jgi:hypothetical protein
MYNMSAITFDTLKYVDRLQAAGISDAHAWAEAQALRDALAEAINDSVATKRDLVNEVAPVKADVAVLKWMIGFNLAFTMAVLWKVLG